MSLSGATARITDVRSNCKINWDRQDDKSWHGFAILPKHSSQLFAMGRIAGTRLELKSIWKHAVVEPPYDFVVASGPGKSSKFIFRGVWCASMAPTIVDVQMTPYPVGIVLKRKMVDTTKIPWKDIKTYDLSVEPDGSKSCTVTIDEPRKSYMYRILWKPPQKKKTS